MAESFLSMDGFTKARVAWIVLTALGSAYSFYHDEPFPGILLAGTSGVLIVGGGMKS